MDYEDFEAKQSFGGIWSAVSEGDLPWTNEEYFEKWVKQLNVTILEESIKIAQERGLGVEFTDNLSTVFNEAFDNLNDIGEEEEY